MHYEITHRTIYEYGDEVPECFNIVRLNPRPIDDQLCLEHTLQIEPHPNDLIEREDFFGNRIEQFSIHVPHPRLSVTAYNRVKVTARNYPALETTPAWESIAGLDLRQDLLAAHLIKESPLIPYSGVPHSEVSQKQEIREYTLNSFTPGRPIGEAAWHLTSRIFEDFKFDSSATTVSTPVDEVFENRAGVCQDFAHLQIACFRSLNLPARYVSGYLRTIPPPGKKRLVGADASHAWVGLYCGEAGWFDYDPTNNLMPATDHITIGWGRDYSDVCPIQGVITGGGQTVMQISVDVAPIE